jgi:hypothetical protein
MRKVRSDIYWSLLNVPKIGAVMAATFDTLVNAFPTDDEMALELVPGPASLSGPGKKAAAALLRKNAAQGAAFEKEVAEKLSQTQANVVQQVTVKTRSGVRTRLDIVGLDAESGSTILTEAKSSAKAPLTKNQRAAFPEIQQSGATVLGQGKPGVPGGTEIPPTNVNIIRPD